MLRSHPQIYMPDSKEPWFFAAELHVRAPPRPGRPRRRRSRSTSRCSPAPRPGSAPARPPRLYLWSHTAASADRRGRSRTHASSRFCASRRASCARCTCSSCRRTSRPRAICARRSRSEDARRQGRDVPRHTTGRRRCCTPTTCATSSSCAATTPCSRREQMLVLIYDDFRADNEATCGVSCASSRSTTTLARADARDANPPVRVRSQRLNELMHALSTGRGPASSAW